jgi:hypothetical protein
MKYKFVAFSVFRESKCKVKDRIISAYRGGQFDFVFKGAQVPLLR